MSRIHADEHLAENIFWVPRKARWLFIQAQAKQTKIGTVIDEAITEIEGSSRLAGSALSGDVAIAGSPPAASGSRPDAVFIASACQVSLPSMDSMHFFINGVCRFQSDRSEEKGYDSNSEYLVLVLGKSKPAQAGLVGARNDL